MTKQVPTRIANVLMNALKGGVVPRTGLEYITVGRSQEIAAILHDIEMIEEFNGYAVKGSIDEVLKISKKVYSSVAELVEVILSEIND